MPAVRNGMRYMRRNGVGYTIRRAWEKVMETRFGAWEKAWAPNRADEAELERQRKEPVDAGLISIVTPVWNTRPDLLQAMIDSVTAQTYGNWELCLYDGASTREGTRDVLRKAGQQDSRIRVICGEENRGIAGNSNLAADMAAGQWLALMDHDDLLEPDALYRVAECILRDDPDVVYTDEDMVTENGTVHTDPHLKPDWCPDNLRAGNYVCHFLVMKAGLFRSVGGFRTGYDGSQDHDLILRLGEQTGKISHVNRVLYHWRRVGSSASHSNLEKCWDATVRAVQDHLERTGLRGQVTMDRSGVISICYDTPKDAAIEIIVIECGDPNRWGRLYHTVGRMASRNEQITLCSVSPWQDSADRLIDRHRARWVKWENGESMYAAMNRAAATSCADYLVFLYGSVEMRGDEWPRELMMYAQRSDVGAVTPRIDGGPFEGVAHAGFAVGMKNLAAGRGMGHMGHAGGWHDVLRYSHNVAACSAGCVMIARSRFLPFDERYTQGLGAVDWCLQLLNSGLRNVYTPHAVGACGDRSVQGWLLLKHAPREEDWKIFEEKWGSEPLHDPCYNSRLNREKADFRYHR